MLNKKHVGQAFDEYLQEEGMYEEVTVAAIKKVIAYQIQSEMQNKKLSKIEMARLMKTSRSSLDRLLDPTKDVKLQTVGRAARILGKRLELNLVDSDAAQQC